MNRLRLPRMGLGGFQPASFALAFVLGAAGGLFARTLGLPLPMLLGSLTAVGAVAMTDPLPGGLMPSVPPRLRTYFIPVIGVAIGAAFTPEILENFLRWWPSLAALCLFVPTAHALGFMALRRGGVDLPTAFWGAVPGGLIESVMLGEEAGADVAMLTMLQFLRLILCILVVPLGFTLATGEAVGSSSGATIGTGAGLDAVDWLVLIASGAAGLWVGRVLHFPASFMTGPILVSGLAHLAGLVEGAPPSWLIQLTQLVVGVSLGTRFAGMAPRAVLTAMRLASVNLVIVLTMAGLAALVLPALTGEPWQAVVLAYAPGGLAEMSLVALSLEVGVLYVTAHHVARIILSVGIAKLASVRLGAAPQR